MDGRTDR